MSVTDAIRERRSIRKYEPRPVPEQIVKELLSLAAYSPSAMHREPWRFIIVTDPKKIRELSDAVKRLMPLIGLAARFVERMQSREDTIFYGAPLLILVCAPKGDNWAMLDCGILAQTMFLAAQSHGIGSCFIGFAQSLNKDEKLLKELGVPSGQEIVAPLIFGYPAEKKEVPERKYEDKVLKWYK